MRLLAQKALQLFSIKIYSWHKLLLYTFMLTGVFLLSSAFVVI